MNKYICMVCGYEAERPKSHERIPREHNYVYVCDGSFELIKEFPESFNNENVSKDVLIELIKALIEAKEIAECEDCNNAYDGLQKWLNKYFGDKK